MSHLTPAEGRDRCWIQSGPREASTWQRPATKTAHSAVRDSSLEATYSSEGAPAQPGGHIQQ